MVLSTTLGRLRRGVFGIDPRETNFEFRGFPGKTQAGPRAHLERIASTFVHGYHAALNTGTPEAITPALYEVPLTDRGFAFEGAAMGFCLLDCLTPWRRDRFSRFLKSTGSRHVYMVYVGAGWALARLGRPLEPWLASADPLLGWLAVDGYGFHEGFFHWERYIGERNRPERLKGYASHAFDQGLGRCLWFVFGTSVPEIAKKIQEFDPSRRSDLWSGVGLAAGYAGGVERAALEELRRLAGDHAPSLGQGSAFAAKARAYAENQATHTEVACDVFCGCSARDAAAITDETVQGLPGGQNEVSYETWRTRIMTALRDDVRRGRDTAG